LAARLFLLRCKPRGTLRESGGGLTFVNGATARCADYLRRDET
jgi:hypothetical protein